MSKEYYMNFPVPLLKNFVTETKKSLDNIFAYCVYVAFEQWHWKENEVKNAFSIATYNKEHNINIGRFLYEDNRKRNEAMTGFSVNKFWEMYNGHVTDREKITLLAFLAIKSIVGDSPCYKVTNQFLIYSRMAGFSKVQKKLPKEIAQWCSRWNWEKIKLDLKEYYHVSFYAYHCRGQWISTKLSFEDLCRFAEKKKLSARMQTQKDKEKEARKRVMEAIGHPEKHSNEVSF
jgi:hypothetical protein